jgi:hypothetical protein
MFFFYRAFAWARKLFISCTIDSDKMLRNIMLCYYFGLIIPFNVKIINTSVFQIHKVPYITTSF